MKTATNKKSDNPPKSEGYKAGLAMRKKVLGDDYVERSFANADDLNMPFQELATEFAWGKVWTRPGLTLKERSLATLLLGGGAGASSGAGCGGVETGDHR